MKNWLLISVVLTLGTGCTAIRATTAQSAIPLVDRASCLTRDALTEELGGVDRRIDIPGGGQIEVFDVRLRPSNTNVGRAWVLSVASLGIADVAAGIVDSTQECTGDMLNSDLLSRCDYKVLQYYAHYASESSEYPACVEMREVWQGAGMEALPDDSSCRGGYRAALAEVMDTSELPAPVAAYDDIWNAELSAQAHLERLESSFGRQGCFN